VTDFGSGSTADPAFASDRCRVAVVGVGSIGSVFAAALEETGRQDVLLCVRRRAAGYVVVAPTGNRRELRGRLVTDPQSIDAPVDWLFLATKAHQTPDAANWFPTLVGPDTQVAVLQNGVDQVERVGAYVAPECIVPVVVWCPASSSEPGVVRQRGAARLVVPDTAAGRAVAARFVDSRVSVDVTADFVSEAWRKLVLNAVTGLMALTGRDADIYRSVELRILADRLAAECVSVARCEGAQLSDLVAKEVVAHLAGSSAGSSSSILADRRAGRPLEWDARNGVVQRLGRRHGVATPVSDVIVPLLAQCNQSSESLVR
jgi:2-dehydropantoate 2-reductase